MKQFRLKYEDNTCSQWLNLEEYTIKQMVNFGKLWKDKFYYYQIEYREV